MFLRERIETWVVRRSAVAFGAFEAELDVQLKESLEKQISVIDRVHAGGSNLDKLDALMVGFRNTYRARLETAVDYMYADYALEAARLRQYFTRLQTAKNLTGTEKLHKELFESWIVLVEKRGILNAEIPDEESDDM